MKKFEELTTEVLNELEKRGNAKLSRDTLRYFWNGLGRYLSDKGFDEFELNVAMEYLEMRTAKTEKKRYIRFIKRAVLLLDHYSKFGEIPLRIYTPIAHVTNGEYIALLYNYGEYLNEREYSLQTIDGYLSYVGKFLDFADINGFSDISTWNSTLIFEYIKSLSNFAKTSIKSRTGTLRLFSKYLYIESIISEDLSVYIGTARANYHQKLPSVWTKREVLDLLNEDEARACRLQTAIRLPLRRRQDPIHHRLGSGGGTVHIPRISKRAKREGYPVATKEKGNSLAEWK